MTYPGGLSSLLGSLLGCLGLFACLPLRLLQQAAAKANPLSAALLTRWCVFDVPGWTCIDATRPIGRNWSNMQPSPVNAHMAETTGRSAAVLAHQGLAGCVQLLHLLGSLLGAHDCAQLAVKQPLAITLVLMNLAKGERRRLACVAADAPQCTAPPPVVTQPCITTVTC